MIEIGAIPTRLPREIAPSIFWLGACVDIVHEGVHVHQFQCAFLVRGASLSMLIDTGAARHRPQIEKQLDDLLGSESLDILTPTHLELAHAGNLHRLLAKYPKARIVGDIRDYHLYFPDFVDRLVQVRHGQSLDLGGGLEVVVLPAPLKDMRSTIWAYEKSRRVMFVGDGFAYVHDQPGAPDIDGPLHRPGQCALLSTELPSLPRIQQATMVTRAALVWSCYVDADPIFKEVDRLLAAFPPAMIAPSHGNVIANPTAMMPVIREAFKRSYEGALEGKASLKREAGLSTSINGGS